MKKIQLVLLLLLVLATNVVAGSIWYEDNNFGKGGVLPEDFVFKFQKPESWNEAHGKLDVYMFRANIFNVENYPQLTDQFLTLQMLPLLKGSQISVALNSAAAFLTGCESRSARIKAELEWLSRMKRLGFAVDYLSMQSILSKPSHEKSDGKDCSLAERVNGGLTYAKQFAMVFPAARIGIIDALPSHGKPYKEAYKYARDTFQQQNIPLKYIHLDVSADMIERGLNDLSWKKIIEVEDYVHKLGLEFGLIFTSRKAGHASDEVFFKTIIAELDEYLAAGGMADHYIIASWFPYPLKTVRHSPEDRRGYPITDAIVEFSRRLQAPPIREQNVHGK